MRFGLFRVPVAAAIALAALCGTCLAAATPGVESTPIPTAPKPNWSSMQFLTGTWNCSSQSSRRPTPYTSVTTTSMDPTGYWMVTKSVSPKVSWAPGINSTDMVTYDSDQHRWIDMYSDDQGGYGVTFSPGWNGDSMVWTDPLFAPGPDVIAASPLTVTKVSASKTTAHNTFKEKSGRTNTLDTVCSKTM